MLAKGTSDVSSTTESPGRRTLQTTVPTTWVLGFGFDEDFARGIHRISLSTGARFSRGSSG
jgi:hypothetical protein